MGCLSFFINKKNLGKKLCVGACLKCLTVATTLAAEPQFFWSSFLTYDAIKKMQNTSEIL